MPVNKKDLLGLLPVMSGDNKNTVAPTKENSTVLLGDLPVVAPADNAKVVKLTSEVDSIPSVDAQGNPVYRKRSSIQTTQGVPNEAAVNSLDQSMTSFQKFVGTGLATAPDTDHRAAVAHKDASGNITVNQYDLNNGDPKLTTLGLSEYEKQNAQYQVGKEIKGAQDFIAKDFQENIGALKTLAGKGDAFGVTPPADNVTPDLHTIDGLGQAPSASESKVVGSFGSKLTNPNGDTRSLEDYVKARIDLLNQTAQTKLQDLDARYPVKTYPLLDALTGNTTIRERENQDAYNVEKEGLMNDIAQQHQNITNAATSLAYLKSVNEKLTRNVHPKDIDPAQVGMEVKAMVGGREDVDRQQRYIRKGMGLTPDEKVENEEVGYRAMQYAMMDAFSKGKDEVARSLADKVKNYRQKILDSNPDFKKQQLVKALSNEIYKNESAIMQAVFNSQGHTPEDNDPEIINEAARRLGINQKDLVDISMDDIQKPKNVLSRGLASFFDNAGAEVYKGIARPLAQATNAGYTPFLGSALLPKDVLENPDGAVKVDMDRFNQHFDANWYDNSLLGKTFKGATPEALKLFGSDATVETDAKSPGYLFNKANESAGNFNWDVRAILDQMANGAGQMMAFSTVGGKLGDLSTAAKLVRSTEAADRLGIAMSTVLTQHANSYDDALQTFGDKPEDEGKRLLYAFAKDLSSAGTEMIYPDQQIARNFLGKGSPAGSAFIDYIKNNSLKSLEKETMGKLLGKALFEGTKDWAKETSEDVFDDIGGQIIDHVLAPKKYDNADYTEQMKQTIITSAISSFLPTFTGGMKKTYSESRFNKEMLFHVGVNGDDYVNAINSQVADGSITKQDADSKIKLVNTMQSIVYNSVPEESAVNGKKLTRKQAVDYANNLLQQAIAKHTKDKAGDEVQAEYIDKHIEALKVERAQILANAGQETIQPTSDAAAGGNETSINSPQSQNNGNSKEGSNVNGQEARSAGNQDGTTQNDGQGQQGSQEQNVLSNSGVGNTTGDLTTSSGEIKTEAPVSGVYSFEPDLVNSKTQQDAITESNQQQQESNQQSDISQHEGAGPGQQEAGQGAGSEWQGAQSSTDGSNSDQRSSEEKVGGVVGDNIKQKWDSADKVDGIDRTRTLADGSKLAGNYVLTTADAMTPSHSADTFGNSEGFPMLPDGRNPNDRNYSSKENKDRVIGRSTNYNGLAVENVPTVDPNGVVIDGNDRVMSGLIAARNGTDAEYIAALKENAQSFGFTPEQIDEMVAKGQSPRVVFVAKEAMPYTTESFAKFNQRTAGKAKTNAEEAIQYGRTVSNELVSRLGEVMGQHESTQAFYDSKTSSKQVKDLLMQAGVFTTDELPRMYDVNTQQFTDDGKRVLQNVLIGKVFDESVISLLNKYKAIRNQVLLAMNNLMAIESRPEYSLKEIISGALLLKDRVADHMVKFGIKGKEEGIVNYLRNIDMFYTPTEQDLAMLHILDMGKQKALQNFTGQYLGEIEKTQAGAVENIFGEKNPTSQELILRLNESYKDYEKAIQDRAQATADIFAQPDATAVTADNTDAGQVNEAVAPAGIAEDQKGITPILDESALSQVNNNVTPEDIEIAQPEEQQIETDGVSTISPVDISAISSQALPAEIVANWNIENEGDFLSGTSGEVLYIDRVLGSQYGRAKALGEIETNAKVTYEIGYDYVYAYVGNKIPIGFIKLENRGGPSGVAHIAVAPEFRRRGVGKRLYEEAKTINPKLDLAKSKQRSESFAKFANSMVPSPGVVNSKAPAAGPVAEKKAVAGKPVETGDPATDAVNTYNWLKNVVAKKEHDLELMDNREDRGGMQWKEEQAKINASLKALYPKLDAAEKQANTQINKAAKEAEKKVKNADKKVVAEKKAKQAKAVADTVRKAKIKGMDNTALTTPVQIPVSLWNASVETVALAIEGGQAIANAVQSGVDFIKDRWYTRWDEVKFRDLMGENSLFPVTPEQIRAKLESIIPLSVANKTAADQMVADVKDNKLTLPDAINVINSIPDTSDALREKIKQYVTRAVNESIFNASGMELADKFATAASDNYEEAIKDLLDDQKVAVLNAADQTERDNVRMKYAMALSELQVRDTNEKVANGTITPVYSPGQKQYDFNPRKRNMKDAVQENVQDRYARLERMVEASTVDITERNDAATAARLKSSKASNIIEEIRHFLGNAEYIKGSFYDRMKKDKINIHELGLYQYAKHAQERNEYNAKLRRKIVEAKIRELNGKIASGDGNATALQAEIAGILSQKDERYFEYSLMPDGGSGMTNAQAQEILDEVENDGKTALFEKYDQEFRANVTDKILDYKYDSQLIDEATYNKLKTFYKNYVPLKVDLTEEEEAAGNNKKYFADSGKSGRDLYRSKGSVERTYTERNNPLLQAVTDLESAVKKAEDNKFALILAELVKANPNPNVWEERTALYDVLKDPQGNVLRAIPQATPKDVIGYYKEGVKHLIVLHDEGLKNMVKQVGNPTALRIASYPSRVFTSFATLLNAEFVFKNPFIDQQDAYSNLLLQNNGAEKKFRGYMKDIFRIAKYTVTNSSKGKQLTDEWKGWADRWRKAGGSITFMKQFENPGKSELHSEKLYRNYGAALSKANFNHYFRAFSNTATFLEQMTRIMAFRAAVESGANDSKAAVISRNATVDFEKKGVYGAWINAFKTFANAGTQGMATVIYNATRKGPGGAKYRKFLGLLVIGGFLESMLGEMAGDCKDITKTNDCYDRVSEFDKQRNFIIPGSYAGHGVEGYMSLPAGRNFGWFKYLGNVAYAVARGTQDPGEGTLNTLSSLFSFYNPIGGDAPLIQQAAGSIGAPFIQSATNTNSFGGKIRPGVENKMDSKDYWPSTGKAYVEAAKAFHSVSGGTDEREGAIEVSPNTLQFAMQSVFSGLYSFLDHTTSTVQSVASGDKIDEDKIPFYRVFRVPSNMGATKGRFFDIADKSEKNILTDKEDAQAKEELARLVSGGAITPDQSTKWYGNIKRNQTTIKSNLKKENRDASPDISGAPTAPSGDGSAPTAPDGGSGAPVAPGR